MITMIVKLLFRTDWLNIFSISQVIKGQLEGLGIYRLYPLQKSKMLPFPHKKKGMSNA